MPCQFFSAAETLSARQTLWEDPLGNGFGSDWT